MQNIIKSICTDSSIKCKYCGGQAYYFLGENKYPCCQESYNGCPEVRRKNSEGLKRAHKLNPKKNFFAEWAKTQSPETLKEISKRAGRTLSNRIKEGLIVPHFKGKKHSEETRAKWKSNPNMGGYRQGSGRGKKGWYKGYYCRSTWELAWLIYQLDKGEKVIQDQEHFSYEYENKIHQYYPDFKIGNKIYEIKGYHTPSVDAKIKGVPADREYILIEGQKEIQPYIDYVKSKYNVSDRTLYNLYDSRDLRTVEQEKKLEKRKKKKEQDAYELLEKQKNLILSSGCDFTKSGWKSKVIKLTGLSRKIINKIVLKYPECFKDAYFLEKVNKGEANNMYGKHWYTNEEIDIVAYQCPEGFRPGKSKK